MNDVLFKKKEGLAQQAYKQLKSMILSHHLKSGMVVNEAQLQEALGIGRTPVREALLQLSKEQFLIIHPRRGIEIARISPKRIRDIFQVRSLLEPHILRIGMNRIDIAWISKMKEEFLKYAGADFDLSSKNAIELSNLDNEFHMGIVASIDNYYTNELMESFQDYLTLFRASTQIDLVRFGPSNQEHIAIIDAILSKDIDLACDTLTDHLTRSYEESIKIVMDTTI
ncbi:MAG: GntR family transcriptional regulator [Anaerovorax sp.]|nr:GntR family transcriptional regulator [Anaerovorax sp.]